MQRARPILWDIYEEHLDEAAFLWGAWEEALVAANYTLAEVAEGPEERLLAHLDGLVLGGKPVAERLLLPAFAEEDPGKVAAAAWSLLQAEDADHFDTVLGAFPKAGPPARAAIGRALELSHRRDLASRMVALWPKSDEALRGVIFEVAAQRDPAWASAALSQCISTHEVPLLAAALRAARRAPDSAFTPYVQQAFSAEDATVRAEAIATGFVMGTPGVTDACRREAQTEGDRCRLPLALLAISPANRDLVLSRLANPESRRHAMWALGFAADVEAADAAVAALDDEKVARVAGETLSAITGVVVAGPFSKPGETKGPNVVEVGDDDPPPEVLPEDHLLIPNTDALRKWWQGARPRFQRDARYVGGVVRSPESLEAALHTSATWRRPVLSMEAAAQRRAPMSINPRLWTRRQRNVA